MPSTPAKKRSAQVVPLDGSDPDVKPVAPPPTGEVVVTIKGHRYTISPRRFDSKYRLRAQKGKFEWAVEHALGEEQYARFEEEQSDADGLLPQSTLIDLINAVSEEMGSGN